MGPALLYSSVERITVMDVLNLSLKINKCLRKTEVVFRTISFNTFYDMTLDHTIKVIYLTIVLVPIYCYNGR